MELKYTFDNGDYEEDFIYDVDYADLDNALTKIIMEMGKVGDNDKELILKIVKELDLSTNKEILDLFENELLEYFEDKAMAMFNDYIAEKRDPYGYRGIRRDDIDGI